MVGAKVSLLLAAELNQISYKGVSGERSQDGATSRGAEGMESRAGVPLSRCEDGGARPQVWWSRHESVASFAYLGSVGSS